MAQYISVIRIWHVGAVALHNQSARATRGTSSPARACVLTRRSVPSPWVDVDVDRLDGRLWAGRLGVLERARRREEVRGGVHARERPGPVREPDEVEGRALGLDEILHQHEEHQGRRRGGQERARPQNASRVGSDQRTLGDELAPPRALIEPSRAVFGETQQFATRVARARRDLRDPAPHNHLLSLDLTSFSCRTVTSAVSIVT
jgi:hypothetical protein